MNAGSSAGSEDYSAQVVERLGALLVHGIAVRPGHPVILGTLPPSPGSGSLPTTPTLPSTPPVIPTPPGSTPTTPTLPSPVIPSIPPAPPGGTSTPTTPTRHSVVASESDGSWGARANGYARLGSSPPGDCDGHAKLELGQRPKQFLGNCPLDLIRGWPIIARYLTRPGRSPGKRVDRRGHTCRSR